MALPTAFSFQIEHPLGPHFFLNGTLIQRIPKMNAGVDRENLVAIAPKYETRNFEVSLPLQLYSYIYPRMGIAVRYGILTLGTDRLGAWTGSAKMSGWDIFFSIKINSELFGERERIKPKRFQATRKHQRKGSPLCFSF